MKLEDLELVETDAVDGDLLVEEEEDDTGSEAPGVEEDLSEALELLEACLSFLDNLMKPDWRGKYSWRKKELEDLALEITGFLNQWENSDGSET